MLPHPIIRVKLLYAPHGYLRTSPHRRPTSNPPRPRVPTDPAFAPRARIHRHHERALSGAALARAARATPGRARTAGGHDASGDELPARSTRGARIRRAARRPGRCALTP